jgi:hypothetical protein
MSADVFVCTSCGVSHAEASKFCTSCGEPMGHTVSPTDSTAGSTTRLGGAPAIPAASTAPTALASPLPPTQVLPSGAAASSASVAGAPPGASPGRKLCRPLALTVAAALLAIVVAAIGRMLLPSPPSVGAHAVDRFVVRSNDGETTRLTVMRSDGSGATPLVEGPSESVIALSAINVARVNADSDITIFRGDFFASSMPGAMILGSQQRIVLWHPTDNGVEVRSTNLDGGDQVSLGTLEAQARLVVPEVGDRVLMIDTTDEGARLRAVTLRGEATPIVAETLDVNATISPDGRHIAYWVSDDNRLVSLWATDGSVPGTLVARGLRDVGATFSADSSRLFVNRVTDSGTSFITADASGENPIVLSRSGSGTGQVARGRLIYSVTTNGATSLFTSDLRGDDRVEIVRDADDIQWRLTPARDHIIFTQQRNGRASFRMTDLRNENQQDLDRSDGGMIWFPLDNGRLLLMRHGSIGLMAISTMDMDGSDEVVLARNIAVRRIDDRGDAIVVSGQVEGRSAVYLYRSDEAMLIDDEADDYDHVAFAPDGRIVYTAIYRSGPVTYIVDQQGEQRKLVLEGDEIVASGL